MALKDLMVCLDATERSPMRLQLAVDLARRNGSCITALFIRGWDPAQLAHRQTAEFAGRPMQEMHALDSAVEYSIERSGHQQRLELERSAARYGLRTEWRTLADEPGMALPQQARYADLCILGIDTPAQSTLAGNRLSEELPFVAGRPTLLIPPSGDFATLGGHIAIAWNSSRAAARAVGDALPLLEHSEQTTVLAINAADYIGRHGGPPLQALIDHLHRHGLQPKIIQADHVAPERIADELQERARAAGADLMVAGAYGHSRWREILLGGVTRDLLARAQLPLMMAH